MTTSRSVRDHLRATRIRLRPAARRRALLSGLAAGPLATAGFAFVVVGASSLLAGPTTTSWIFAGVGLLTLVGAFSLAVRLMRPHHRGTRTAVQGVVLVGFPIGLLATSIIASVIISLSVGLGPVGGQPWVVFPVAWLAVALPGLVLGPFAMWWTAHMNRHLPTVDASDEVLAAKYERTTMTD